MLINSEDAKKGRKNHDRHGDAEEDCSKVLKFSMIKVVIRTWRDDSKRGGGR